MVYHYLVAVSRFADFKNFLAMSPGVTLRSTPGFMLSPAPRAG
jgi:hypothetical protein